jgi:branched-chain amino acid transport system ATP-binding protein
MPLLSVHNLRAGYGEAVVLSDFSFDLAPGETLAILGRNGVGKTTLIQALMGQARIMSGDIFFAGERLNLVGRYNRAAIGLGWVPQERDIFASLTVSENLRVGARPGKFDIARIYDMMPRLHERRGNFGDQLSGGEQQMLAIGRALMVNPRLLLLDEPFEGLAPIIVQELEHLIRSLKNEHGLSCIIVEQHAKAALALSDRGLIIERGRIAVQASATELLEKFDDYKRYLAV